MFLAWEEIFFLNAGYQLHGSSHGKLTLTVNVSTKLNRTHLVHGDEAIIFPTLARSDQDMIDGKDQFVSCENSMGIIQSSKGVLKPISKDLRNENEIICGIAKVTMGDRTKVDWDRYAKSYDAVRDLIEQCIPGFEQYNDECGSQVALPAQCAA